MIDFRYHLISIVAVFLALGIGILMGSVVLDQRLVNLLENELKALERTNRDLRTANRELRDEMEIAESFAVAARALLLPGRLAGRDVVLVTFAGTEAEVLDAVRAGIDQAGGEVAGTIVATEKLALSGTPERDELALIVDSLTSTSEALRLRTGSVLGGRAGAAAVATAPAAPDEARAAGAREPPSRPASATRLANLLTALSDGGFLEIDAGRDDVVVPEGAGFIVVGGSDSPAPFSVADFTVALVTALARPHVPVVVAESSASTWNVAEVLRADDEAQGEVATVDQAESTSGTIAVVLAYEQAQNGCTGRHYGVSDGVAGIIPRPPDDC